MTATLEPTSLRDLVNQLNRPSATAAELHGIEIEQDWVEALRRGQSFEPAREDIHLQALANLIEEVATLRLRLAISEGRRAQLEQLIDTDPLCPVLNRRAFERELSRAISWSKRTSKPGSVLFLDMNGLKQVNDTYGHAAGDKAIERVAKMLILSCRSTDSIGRLGGDEFAVIMPDTPPSGALIRGERVSELLAKVPLMIGEIPVTLSAAFGTAEFSGGTTAKAVLERADAAMYAHKQKIKTTF
jgi:diguanylate cyclase (GGDEF)-like protein